MTAMPQELLKIRSLVPLFELPAANRSNALGPWNYKQKKSLVILFLHRLNCELCQTLLQDLAQHYESYQTADTEVLILFAEPLACLKEKLSATTVPFPILADADGKVYSRYIGPARPGEPPQVGMFICDRFGELYLQTIAAEADELPSEPEIRDWATFIDMRCPECFPPEW